MDYDVIIAGAGPVGLFLASELRLAKLSVLVLERAETPDSPAKRLPLGMRGLWGPSIEAFYRRGLLDAMAAPALAAGNTGLPKPGAIASASQRSGPAGHFAGIQFDYANIDSSRWSYRLAGPSDLQLGLAMEHIERVLTEHALALGVQIERGQGVDGVVASEDDVTVHAGGARLVRARYLVGCDGGRSTVRKLAGFDFVGTEPDFTGYSLMVELADPEKLRSGRHYTASGVYTQWQPGVLGLVDFDGGSSHRAELTRDDVQAVLRRVSCTDVTVNAVSFVSTWTDRAKQATTYRKGRVLLAGDAAHVHSPLGGQGLNLGLGDALNLGWKLAATMRGAAPDGLLDSYSAERHPIGARILDWTRAQVTLMRPNAHARALEAIMRDLLNTRDGATYFAERLWGLSLRYDLGAEQHPLVGRSCPDFELADGSRVGTLLRAGSGLLLEFGGLGSLSSLHGQWGDQVQYVNQDVKDRLGLSALLVRPDGFVAWATDTAPQIEDVTRAAAPWFAPRASS